MEPIFEDEYDGELKVTFLPELHLQRRIWILNILRKEGITHVLDVGCGEGQLLIPLVQPAPWLASPPANILPRGNSPSYDDEIPNLHIAQLHALDTSAYDIEFAARETAPPSIMNNNGYGLYGFQQRWENLEVKLWRGGLEVYNEEFVDIECIVSTEVIEHLPSNIFPTFAPMLLGMYHPRFLLVTTPSYTYNARFTAPNAPQSARQGYPDPTGRTDRIFRHSDHKFEWTAEEFKQWCQETAEKWGYEVEISGVGRAVEPDPWNRDEELGEATSVACFRKTEKQNDVDREKMGREELQKLALPDTPHACVAMHVHQAHPSSQKPKSLEEISDIVVQKMDLFREALLRIEELWFEPDVATACGGWIEFLVKAVDESKDLSLVQEEDPRNHRTQLKVERVGAPDMELSLPLEDETSIDYIPPDWASAEAVFGDEDDDEGEHEDMASIEENISWGYSEGHTEDDWGQSLATKTAEMEGWVPEEHEESGHLDIIKPGNSC